MSVGIGPLTIAAGVQASVTVGARSGTSAVVLYNESQNLLQVSGGRYNNYQIPAWTGDILTFASDSSFSGAITITPIDISNATMPPSSVVAGNIYTPGEPISGTYPVALVRQTTSGGGTVTNNQQVNNDNNPRGTTFIEATPTTFPSSAVRITNDGTVTWQINSYAQEANVWNILQGDAGGNAFNPRALMQIMQMLLQLQDTSSNVLLQLETPDNAFRTIKWNSPTKEVITWNRNATGLLAIDIVREALNGYTLLHLSSLDTSGNQVLAGSLQIDNASGHSSKITHVLYGNLTTDGSGNATITHNFGVGVMYAGFTPAAAVATVAYLNTSTSTAVSMHGQASTFYVYELIATS